MRYLSTLLLIVAMESGSFAKAEESTQDSSRSRSLVSFFKAGKMNGHFRYYFMTTDNQPGLQDYHANAIGGGLRYETAPFHGFQIGIAGFYIFNIGSSDLTKRDPKTNQLSRYETGQFNIRDLGNKHDMDRLEDLFLKYSIGKTSIVAGRQNIKSPFINPQDGRMRPTAESGVWVESLGDIKNTEIRAGFIHAISPRGTLEWFHLGESIGVYSAGVDIYGDKSKYASQIHSDGVFLSNVTHNFKKKVKVQVWNQFVQNIFNTAMVQADGTFPLVKDWNLVTGFQYIRQDAVANGGNTDQTLTYAHKGWKSNIFGVRLGVKNKNFETHISYTRITRDGRFLMPREWGREPLYTFMARERNEGAGNVHAFVFRIANPFPKARLRPEIAVGYYRLPDVTDFRLNKYGMPSYWQINTSLKYEFEGFMKGLDAEILALYKGISGETYNNPTNVFNKVDMFHLNVILNYHF